MTKTNRLEMRLTLAQKQTLQRAASLKGVSVTEFATQTLLGEAEAVIAPHQKILVSEAAFDQLLRELEGEPKVVPALLEQFRKAAR